METPVAYYSDGVPYDSSGNVIITISNGVSGSVGANPKSPSPVFVNWPGMGGPHGGGGGIIDYNPNKLPFTGLWKMSEGVTKINKLLEQARNAYPQNAEQIRDEASALLADLRNTGLINNPDINPAANALQEAVNSLQINIDLKNQTELAVSSASQDAVNAFREFMNNNKLSNFIDKPADMIDLAIATSRWLHKPWDNTVVPKFSAEIEVKNKLVTYLDRGNTITADVVSKKNA
ncbi:colicin, partial [Escherichia coli]|nr:colicin [Escherichia coli]MBZ8964267.1 colicin [Escherichia coli]MBZ8969156.1 colicin [Escherichia coli]MBZ8973957.1 colicin [Escherichia coli]MBZ8978669.1 colicin [Escherichia coli]